MSFAESGWCDELWKVKESLRKDSPHGATGMQLVSAASTDTITGRPYNSYLETKRLHM